MRIGSLVETIDDFNHVREQWGLSYPHKGDILTVSFIAPHPKWKGLYLLWFEELAGLGTGLCDRQVDGKENFRELQPPMEINIEELIKCPQDLTKEFNLETINF